MSPLWSFLVQIFLSSFPLIHLVFSQQIKVPITATEGSSVTVTVFNDIGLEEYALYLVQDRSIEAFSVFTTITPDASVRAQTVVFPAPAPGEFRIVMDNPSSTISASPSGIGSSEEFEVVSGPDGSSRTSQTSSSSSNSNPQTGTPNQVSATDTMTTIIHGDAGSVTFTVTASPSPGSFDGTNSQSKSPVSIPGLVGGLLGGLITTIILVGLFLWRRRQHRRSIKPLGVEPYNYRPNQRRYVSRYLFPKADSRSELENNLSKRRPDLQSDEEDTPTSAQGDIENGLGRDTTFAQGNDSEKGGVPRRVSRVLLHTDSGWRGGRNNDADEVLSSFSEFPPSYTSS